MTAAAGSIYWSIVIWYSMFNYFLGAKLKIICWPGSFVACTVPLQHQLCWNHYPVSQNVNYVQESFHTLHLWVMLKLSKNNMAFLSTLPFYRVPILPFNRALWFFSLVSFAIIIQLVAVQKQFLWLCFSRVNKKSLKEDLQTFISGRSKLNVKFPPTHVSATWTTLCIKEVNTNLFPDESTQSIRFIAASVTTCFINLQVRMIIWAQSLRDPKCVLLSSDSVSYQTDRRYFSSPTITFQSTLQQKCLISALSLG